ncbi:unnamed protein product [Caenorhabditis angaria]|uniref:Uncharacterized protein n=1 Tax=Caenorhabditis angaria TaxID=860376 RepID=A0A9P1NCN3_9PELO|nr:unnamed protein product [Caenorhabditis angaria]
MESEIEPVAAAVKKMSEPSSFLIEESLDLLNMKSSISPNVRPVSPDLLDRSASPNYGLDSHAVARIQTPRFKRIDFDDRLEELNDKKPAWKSWQENVKDSYYKAKKNVETKKDENEFYGNLVSARHGSFSNDEPAYKRLSSETGFVPSVRSRSSLFSPSLADRSHLASSTSINNMFNSGSGPYAAPAVGISQGIESRYEQRASNVESMLLRTAPLPQSYKTRKEFRKAPEPDNYSEKDDYDFSLYTTARPYYSRPNRDDPDYFDFDLQHSVDLFKRPEGKYTPRRPQEWENKLISESSSKGAAPLSGHMFTRNEADWRNNNTSYLSAALRTPKFWEQRFESIGKHVRDSNPISLESINRRIHDLAEIRANRPVPTRFTEYRDPDFDSDLDD